LHHAVIFLGRSFLTAYRDVTALNPSSNSIRMEFILPRASTLQRCPFLSGSLDRQNQTYGYSRFQISLVSLCIPDRTWRVVIPGLTKDQMIRTLLVDIHFVVIAKREAEALVEDIVVATHIGG